MGKNVCPQRTCWGKLSSLPLSGPSGALKVLCFSAHISNQSAVSHRKSENAV